MDGKELRFGGGQGWVYKFTCLGLSFFICKIGDIFLKNTCTTHFKVGTENKLQ